jgi:hypothetical protein
VKNFIVLSAELSSLSARENLQRTEEMRDLLRGCKWGFGAYRGVQENNLIIPVDLLNFAQYLATRFGQESYLLVTNKGAHVLDSLTGVALLSGRWEEVSESEAKQQEAWTNVDGNYYVIKETK